jgi:pyruvate-ferredoxin/flavodoxin oxidoreductase
MAEEVDTWASQHKLNLFGQELKVLEMQSEAGAGTSKDSYWSGT